MMKHKTIIFFCVMFCTFFLNGCASTSPLPSENFQSIRNNINQYKGETIRLGGKITSVSIFNDEITLEILSIPLGYGQPRLDAQPDGRFVATVPQSKLNEQLNLVNLNGAFVTVIGVVEGPSFVDNRIGYFSTFSIEIEKVTFMDFKQLALSQKLIEEKNNSLEEIRAIIEVKIQELRYLRSLLPQEK